MVWIGRSLLIVGASIRAAAASAVRAHFQVAGFDLFGDADLQQLAECGTIRNYPQEFTQVANSLMPSAWLYIGGLENYPEVVEAISQRHRLLGNSAEVLRAIRDPQNLARVLRSADFCTPRLVFPPEPSPTTGRWLCKARRSSGGLGVRWYRPQTKPAADDYLQEWIPGESQAGVFLAANGRVKLLGVTAQLIRQQWLHSPKFQYAGSLGPLRLNAAERSEWERLGETLATGFGLRGLFGVDAIVNEQGIWPLEVNPRFPASVEVLEMAEGFSAVGLHCQACENGILPQQKSSDGPQYYAGKAILYAPDSRTISPALSQSWLQQALVRMMADIPQPGRVAKHGPIATVLAWGDSPEETLEALKRQAAACYGQATAEARLEST